MATKYHRSRSWYQCATADDSKKLVVAASEKAASAVIQQSWRWQQGFNKASVGVDAMKQPLVARCRFKKAGVDDDTTKQALAAIQQSRHWRRCVEEGAGGKAAIQ